jgi:hypothetical protein
MKIDILAILLLLSLWGIIINVGPLFKDGKITKGQRIYETIRETNADSRPFTVNEEDGRSLIKFIESAKVGEWRARFILLGFSFLVFIGAVCVIAIEYREKAKRKHNQSLKRDAAESRRAP